MTKKITIVGGGLAGSEASYQALKQGIAVDLIEMRPSVSTKAHKTGNLAELVCSNSFKSMDEGTAPGLLKHDLGHLDSLILKSAYKARVPAGKALAVDRELFSKAILDTLKSFENFNLIHKEVKEIPSEQELEKLGEKWILATGPLTTEALATQIADLSDEKDTSRLFFYDAIAPILNADSIKMDEVYRQDRYGEEGKGDYLNIPLSKDEYYEFIEDILGGDKTPLHAFEKTKYFESCLPIEVMAERGPETLRFGPMKPVGLTDPKTGRYPYAAVQLRIENEQESMFSMVGFQTKLTWPEQKRIFSKLKGLGDIEFFRYGSVHRNTYINSPKLLNSDLSFKANKNVYLAGQITGVEGYMESTAMGLLAARFAGSSLLNQSTFKTPPEDTMIGALLSYVTKGLKESFQPMNTNFGILPTPSNNGKKIPKKDKKRIASERSRNSFENYFKNF